MRCCVFPTSRVRHVSRRKGTRVTDLPAGRNHHWTKSLLASRDGQKLYVTVGSNSNVAEKGMAVEEGRAAIWEIDLPSGNKRLYATGLRNPNGMVWERTTQALWTVVNERDELGNDLVPDYLTSVRRNAFYGWPYSYWGKHVDTRVEPQRPDLVATAVSPDYSLGSHVAPLGLCAAEGARLGSAICRRHVRRAARLVEPQAEERLQSRLRALFRRSTADANG